MKAVLAVVLVGLVALVSAAVVQRGSRSANNPPPEWSLGPRASPNYRVKMLIGLKQRNLDKLESLFWAVSTPGNAEYRNFRSAQEIAELVAPLPEHVSLVLGWLAAKGVNTAKDVINHGDSLEVTTTVRIAERLVSSRLHTWIHEQSGKKIVRVVGTWSLPAEIHPFVDLVEGLTEFPVPRMKAKKVKKAASPAAETLVSICPQSINAIYQVPDGSANTGNSSVSVAEWEDQYFDPKQLEQFGQDFGLSIPALTPAHIVGKNIESEPGVESTLDIQYVAGVSVGADAWFWIEGDSAWLWTYAVHVQATSPAPLIFSISYGWSEADQCVYGIGGDECKNLGVNSQLYVGRVNTEFQKVGIRGISLIAASGDSGANGRSDGGCKDKILHPDFPAASPYVTSVGATQITLKSGVANLPNPPPGCAGQNCASAGSEEAVTFAQSSFASGGGFSGVAARPSYQAKAVAAYLASGVALPPAQMFNVTGRAYPDVAAFGSNVLIESGGIQGVGGTSCSAPIFAGLMGMINGAVVSKTGRPLGFLNPLLYKMAAAAPGSFTDIVNGDNKCTEDGCAKTCKGFLATKGWDPVTGLGTPVFKNMQSYIEQLVMNGDKQ